MYSTRVAVLFSIAGFVLTAPFSAYAVGTAANAFCLAKCMAVPAQYRPVVCPTITCVDTTNGGQTTGNCTYPLMECKGKNFSGGAGNAGGGLDSGLGALGSMLGQVLGKLMQGQSGSGSGQQQSSMPSMPYTPAAQSGCTGSYFQTSDVTQLTNPCAQYVAPPVDTTGTAGSGGTCDALSQALGMCGTTGSDVTITNNNINTNTNTTATDTNGTVVTVTGNNATGTAAGLGTPSVLGPSVPAGGIVFLQNGATIFGTFPNLPNNSTISGFYGGSTFGGQPQGIAAQLCQKRPWANNFFSALIPSSFFDGLCTANGYQVGAPTSTPATTPTVQLQQSSFTSGQQSHSAPATTTADNGIPAEVHIWAVPASVPLGTRTLIYWTTQGVTDCTETSPDGNFNQTLLSGGAATVPLTGATTFTISCTDPQGDPITDYVTVNISI